ncbi:shikimate dehydrogenase [Parachitinimonas caeni]|uniref:Shikimate dehydrogenase (NADP(+)) n=1 Tax=Parachitinimonas caeni TaxID=3031301 RepID=A0ABT7DRG8_9NEIS|nr:shikimate dehydrogenase [Parachitinimonas caeni]MDK2122658.1 shikimate dehydrogenase [Parachitinimonas caeni]
MTAQYAVIGHPVAHSKSPIIHAAFAAQTGQRIRYDKLEAPLEGFIDFVAQFFAMGGEGCNVTVPFKEQAFAFANQLTERARQAGAVNTLWLDDDGVVGDNTDGVGLCRDLTRHINLAGKRILLLGAGGAARGAIGALLAEQPAQLTIANRSADKAITLAANFGGVSEGCGLPDLTGRSFDLVINATSASLAQAQLALPSGLFAPGALAYDMMYGQGDTPFMQQARADGAAQAVDGLGMLVEQAAEAFRLWRGVQPDTAPVLAELRASLA